MGPGQGPFLCGLAWPRSRSLLCNVYATSSSDGSLVKLSKKVDPDFFIFTKVVIFTI